MTYRCAVLLAALTSCSGPPALEVLERPVGARWPLTATCDDMDTTRCLLPWPSNRYAVAAPDTATGLRVHIDASALITPDEVTSINRADGFSRVSPLVTAFAADLAPLPTGASGALRLIVAQHDDANLGGLVPLRFAVEKNQTADGGTESFVFAYPLRPLTAASDYVAVVMDDLPLQGSSPPVAAARPALLALGLATPATLAEAQLAAYHAPTRSVLAQAGIDPRHVIRVWDFTTRSVQDPELRLAAMRQGALSAVSLGQTALRITKVDTSQPAPIAVVVEGEIDGLPQYITASAGSSLSLDQSGMPVAIGTRSAPFRVVVPVGAGDYPVVMFGHGTGGSYDDDTLDGAIAGSGASKVGVQWDGWTGDDVVGTFLGLTQVFQGTHHAAGLLMQALADAAAIQTALATSLGDLLAAPQLGTVENPAAGRRPDRQRLLWAGGSLGGILGLVAACADDEVRYGVLNVPGAAWTHYIPRSLLYTDIAPVLANQYQSSVNALQAIAMSQGNWDEIDGAIWSSQLAQRQAAFLVQESIGDPVVPNPGSEMVAVVTSAAQVGAVLVTIAAGILPAPPGGVKGGSAITQFHVTSSDPYAVHGFAAGDTAAGMAARAQIGAFVNSVWAGTPSITIPAGCPSGDCDFSAP